MKGPAIALLLAALAFGRDGPGGKSAVLAAILPEVHLGPVKVVAKHGCHGLRYFPDGAVATLPPTREFPFRMLVPAGVCTYLVEGESLFRIAKVTRVLAPGRSLEKSGIYVAYSADGVKWSRPRMLVKDYAVSRVGKSVSWHPAILWRDAGHSEGWLVYSHSEKWGHAHLGGTPHYMVAREIRFVARDTTE